DEIFGERLPRTATREQVLELRIALRQMGGEREAESGARLIQLDRARVRRVRRDAGANSLRQRLLDPLAQVLEVLERGGVLAEHLQVDDRAQAELGAGGRGSAGEAAIADGRDPGAETLGRAGPGDLEHLLLGEELLARDVQSDPGREGEAVPEPDIRGVLEMGV